MSLHTFSCMGMPQSFFDFAMKCKARGVEVTMETYMSEFGTLHQIRDAVKRRHAEERADRARKLAIIDQAQASIRTRGMRSAYEQLRRATDRIRQDELELL